MVRFRVVDECNAAMSNSLGGPCGAIWRTNKGVTAAFDDQIEFNVHELEQIISKMKELRERK